jgi:hypothetical protein
MALNWHGGEQADIDTLEWQGSRVDIPVILPSEVGLERLFSRGRDLPSRITPIRTTPRNDEDVDDIEGILQ